MNLFSPVTSRLLAWKGFASFWVFCLLFSGGTTAAQSSICGTPYTAYIYDLAIAPPVNLTSLKASASGQSHILVEWSTRGETDNNYFEIERSVDGVTFEVVGRVTGKSTTTKPADYNFFDYYPKSGAAHYRLRQVSFRGYTWTTQEIAIRTDPGARRSLPTLPTIGTGAYAHGLLAVN